MAEVAREQGSAVADLAASLDIEATLYRHREKRTKEHEGFASAQAPLFASIARLFEVAASQERRLRVVEAHPAIARRLALAALRLAILSAATHHVRWISGAFYVAVEWAGGEPNEEAAPFVNAAIDEAVAALREAGEVSE